MGSTYYTYGVHITTRQVQQAATNIGNLSYKGTHKLWTAYIVLHVQKLRTCLQIRTTKAERFAVETHHFRTHSTSVRAARTHNNQTTACYDQAPAMNWDLEVSWGRGVWVRLSDSVLVGLANRN